MRLLLIEVELWIVVFIENMLSNAEMTAFKIAFKLKQRRDNLKSLRKWRAN